MAAKKEADQSQETEKKFTKKQLMNAVQYRGWQILLDVLLSSEKRYTTAEAEKLVRKFLEKEM